ncbi:MAG: M23 family metallopeptidase [Actinomycetales bacterium]|nr:M23 family metallopeptidase [Actinomycetales bacterium]
MLPRRVMTPALMVAGFGVVASVLAGPWGPAQALLPAGDNHGKSSSELRAEKKDVESDIEATEDALAKAGKKVKKAVATFEEVNARWEAAKQERREALDEARAAREEAQAAEARAMRARQALRIAQEQKVAVEGKLDDIHGQMDDMARAVYTRGPLAEIEVILDASSPGDFQARLASVDTVSRMQAGVQQSLTQTEADLVMQGVRLEALRLEAEAEDAKAEQALAEARVALRKARDRQAKVSALRKERRAALGQAQAFKSKVKKRYDNLVAEQQRLAAAARKAAAEEERRRKAAEEAARKAAEEARQRGEEPPPPASPTFTATGSLMMPVAGRPSSNPGPRIHPIFKRKSCHTGWDLAAPTGTPVVAADNGSVATISRGGAYGNAVMLAHGGGMVTFYAHLSSVNVSVGQVVTKGQTVGGVGSTGWSTGPHLHFEVRIDGAPYDPRGWFGGARTRVYC